MGRGGNWQRFRGILIVVLLLGILIGTSALSGDFAVNQKPGAVWLILFKTIIAMGLGMAVFRLFIIRINRKLAEVNQLLQQGQFDVRVNQTEFRGLSRQQAQTVNQLLDTMREKQLWYEGILDAIPISLQAMDNDLNWTFMNRRFERFMIMAGITKDRQSSYGSACSHAGSTVCNTENCGVKQLQRGNAETFFKWYGKDYKLDAAPLRNSKGEQTGFVEVIADLTATLRVNDYIKAEVDRIEANLQMLAEGRLDLNLDIKAADEFTADVKEQFDRINNSLIQVKTAVETLAAEGVKVTSAAREGRLDIRAESSAVAGVFAAIIQGINEALDAIVEPMNEAETVIGRLAVNDFTTEMTGNYQGRMQQFAISVNKVRDLFLNIQDAFVKVSEGDTSRLEEIKLIGQLSDNDQMGPAMVKMLQMIQDMIAEVNMLTEASLSGNLRLRGNAERFEGGYRRVIEGFNQTLDAANEPVTEAVAVLQEMAQGNLTVVMQGDYRGDHAVLKEAVNSTFAALSQTLGDIHTAAQQVASGAEQVANSSQVLSQGASEQASTMEEISASITEIAAQTKQNAANANQANELSLTAKAKAVQGNKQMKAMLQAMEEINVSSANISKIIKVIDEIAFQTNILALNAAVEAARAGQYGKGFAVVAEEVRNLAARSAKAAKETTDLIEGSIKKVENGTEIANETAGALNEIVAGVTRSAELVGEIAVASNEQATGIAQVNLGIDQVSQVIQSNTATSQEGAAASEELSGQAELLKETVGRFKIDGTQAAHLKLEQHPAVSKLSVPVPKPAVKGRDNQSRRTRITLEDQDFGKY